MARTCGVRPWCLVLSVGVAVIIASRFLQLTLDDSMPSSGIDVSHQVTQQATELQDSSIQHLRPDRIQRANCTHQYDDTSYSYWACLPSFLLIGAQKAATTELSEWLTHHPSLLRYRRIEVHFWDCLAGSHALIRKICQARPWAGKPSAQAISLYSQESKLIRTPIGISPLGSDLQTRFLFEKTPSYLDYANPEEIQALLPNVRILVNLRDPSKRMYSAYWHVCKMRHILETCSIEEFSQRVSDLESKLTDRNCMDWHAQEQFDHYYRGFNHGRYAYHLKKWTKEFREKQIYMVFMEDFYEKPFDTVSRIEQYLGIPEFDFRRIATQDPMTKSWSINHKQSVHSYPQLPPEVKARIDNLYRPCNIALCTFVPNQRLPEWLSKHCANN